MDDLPVGSTHEIEPTAKYIAGFFRQDLPVYGVALRQGKFLITLWLAYLEEEPRGMVNDMIFLRDFVERDREELYGRYRQVPLSQSDKNVLDFVQDKFGGDNLMSDIANRFFMLLLQYETTMQSGGRNDGYVKSKLTHLEAVFDGIRKRINERVPLSRYGAG